MAAHKTWALVVDEYVAGRPDGMLWSQRVLDADGRFTLLGQSRVIRTHPYFRLFATTNTVGLGDATGLDHGTQHLNQGQMDRWNIVTLLNYLEPKEETNIVLSKLQELNSKNGKSMIEKMVTIANLTRTGFINGDISTVMSPRTIITWAENYLIFNDVKHSFNISFLNFGLSHNLDCLAVAIEPGAIELILILCFPKSLAKDLVNPKIADFADEYKINFEAPLIQHIDDKLIIEPLLFFIMPSFAAFAEKK